MREHLLMDMQWKFHEGEIEDHWKHGYLYPYMHTKTERGQGPASMDFDDSEWMTVNLPHDYVVHGTPNAEELPNFGCLKRENAWYRKFFRLEPEDADRRITLEFEGICSKSRIWVNGCYMKTNESGYNGFEVDISDIARYGDDLNVVSIYIDNREYEAWWYEGGGIYRHVYLNKTEKVAVDLWGIWVYPEKKEGERWNIPIETTVRNDWFDSCEVRIEQRILDEDGKELASGSAAAVLPARERTELHMELTADAPKLWSLEEPNLYHLVTRIFHLEEPADEIRTTFGFRTIRFDANAGLFLNEKNVKIKGMCLHEDHGSLGAALPDRVKEYRIRRLKEMGGNGYRFSHNPHSPETLDACDRLGVFVMDENRWFESTEDGIARVRSMVRRDRNHPSVIFWSMGNEEFLQAKPSGKKIMKALRAEVHKLDRTRPVMMSMHTGLLEDGAAAESDVIGMNYNIELCAEIHKKYPDKVIVFSECQSTCEGEEDSLGDSTAGMRTWEIVSELPYVCGLFAWTGMDYRGETDYPQLFSSCGAMDYNGHPKDSYYYYQTIWNEGANAYIQPHWNQKVEEGTPVKVQVFTTGDTVSLYLNGKDLGSKPVDSFRRCEWEVPFQPGELKAVAVRDGKPEAEAVRRTTGKPSALRLTPETEAVKNHGMDTVILSVSAVDTEGNVVPDAALDIRFHADCGGELLAVGNGEVHCQIYPGQETCPLYKGTAQGIFRVEAGAEEIRITVSGEGVTSDTISIRTIPAECDKLVPGETSRYVNQWEVSEWLEEKPEAECTEISLHPAEVGHGTVMHDLNLTSGYLLYHSSSVPPRCEEGESLALQFELIEGYADILVAVPDASGRIRRYRAEKTYSEPGEVRMVFPGEFAGKPAEIWVVLGITMPFDGVTKAVRWEKQKDGNDAE